MRRILLGVAGALALAGVATAARAKQVRYVGIHPIVKAEGGGLCYIEAPHVHLYPADAVQYREHDGDFFFVGDPVAFGYDGPRHTYKGHHPIQVDVVVADESPDLEFCYLDGAHYHAFAAPSGPDFQVVGEVTFYVGTPPPVYLEARPAMLAINARYRPIVYDRPVVTVAPPPGWIGAQVDVHVHAAAPTAGVEIVVPVPAVRVDIGFDIGGGLVFDGGHRGRGRGHGHGKHKKSKRWK